MDPDRPQLDEQPTHPITQHLAQIDAIAQGMKDECGYMRNGEWASDDWCGQTAEAVSVYLTSVGVDNVCYMAGGEYEWEGRWIPRFGGTDWDSSHSYIVLADGVIVDPTITQFTRGQFESYPHHPAHPNVAVIEYGHELGALYEAHQTGHGFLERPDWLSGPQLDSGNLSL